MKLTQRDIEKLACLAGSRDRLVFDDVQKGLAVRITATGSKSYLAQYTIGGRRRRVPLGSSAAISLSMARAAAAQIMGSAAMGTDTVAEREARTAADHAAAEGARLTLAVLVAAWSELHLARRRVRYAHEAVRALRHAFSRQWDLPAKDLERDTVVRVLDGMSKNGRVSIASRTAAYGRACFSWALKRGTVGVNPFASLPAIGERPKRDRVLADEELARVWRATAEMTMPFGLIVRLLILTGQRVSEVGGMRWDELSTDLATWTIPAERTKNGMAHVVPLARAVRELLIRLPRSGALAMPGRKQSSAFNGWSKARASLTAISGVANWTLHDLRRTMATGLQRLGIRLEVTEAVLNHISGSRAGIVGIYQRHDWATEKRAALDAWADRVMAIVDDRSENPKSNLVTLAGQ
jgi:integrase